jgi:ferredoxin
VIPQEDKRHMKTGVRKSRRGTRYVTIDTGKCTACWKCIDECKFGVLRPLNMWFHKHVVVEDAEKCRGCKHCIAVCPNGVFEASGSGAEGIPGDSVREKMAQQGVSCNEHITRRSLLQLSGAFIGMAWCGLLLPRCTRRKPSEPTAVLAEAPAHFAAEVQHYYSDRRNDLMSEFDKFGDAVRTYLVKQHEESKVDAWLARSRSEYERLITELPYVGGDKNDLTRILLSTSVFIPLLKILRNEGVSIRQNGHMIVLTASFAYQQRIPWFVKWFMRWNHFSHMGKQRKKNAALLSQQKRYPGDWVFRYVEGDSLTYNHEIIYSECALQKFWTSQGLKEYVPYLCLCDYAIWQAVGIEVSRTSTLGNGGAECDFKYLKKGSHVPPPWPPESHREWTGRFEG